MKRLFILFSIFILLIDTIKAQTAPTVKGDTTKNKVLVSLQTNKVKKVDSADVKLTDAVATAEFGSIDTADLKLKFCDFEKDANAMVLFDEAEVTTGFGSTTIIKHKRIKIFNLNGKDEANINLAYISRHGIQSISDLEAETINLDNGVISFIKVDKQQFFEQPVDKNTRKIAFTFPQVKAGSIIEYSYKLTISYEGGFPDWNFQGNIPVRYSELKAAILNDYAYQMNVNVFQAFAKNTKEIWRKRKTDSIGNKYDWALKNVPSYKEEPYSTCREDNLESLAFFLSAVKLTSNGTLRPLTQTWTEVGAEFTEDEDFGIQLKETTNVEELINKAKLLATDNEKVAWVFNWVKNNFKWNGSNRPYTIDVKKAWQNKTGNSTEINLILYKLLVRAGIKCYPLLVSTRDNGKVIQNYPQMNSFNKADVSASINDNTQSLILDASDKLNTFDNTPFDVLNTTGLLIDGRFNCFWGAKYSFGSDRSYLISIKNETPSREVIFNDAEILPDGKLNGVTQLESFSYAKIDKINTFKSLEESKYIEYLKNGDNSLKVISFKRNNVETDLPLLEEINFQQDLSASGSDDNYIYFNPNLFTGFYTNPFLSEKRNAVIDFGYLNSCNVTDRFKIPKGFKIEALPQSVSLVMPDKSISFRRFLAEEGGYIMIHYVINNKQSIFTADQYISIHDFYKKMFQMLNEQIVLKKI
jgi:transglutaminase-like putative cysteine protease